MKKINFSIEGVKFNIQVDDNDEISVDVALSDKCCNKPAQVISANGVSDLDSVAIATALSLYFNEEGLIVNKMTFRFKICNLLYFGSLSSEMDSAIRLLYALSSYLIASGRMYNESCSDAIRCIIHIFDKIMY